MNRTPGPIRNPPRPRMQDVSENLGSRRTLAAAVSGPVAGSAALCAAERTAAAVRPEAGAVAAVGAAVVDRTPAAVKDFAVRTFGTADKPFLRLGILTLPDSRPLDALPSSAGGPAGCAVLLVLTSKLGARPSPAAGERDVRPEGGSEEGGAGNVGSPSAPVRPEGTGGAEKTAPPVAADGRGAATAGPSPARSENSAGPVRPAAGDAPGRPRPPSRGGSRRQRCAAPLRPAGHRTGRRRRSGPGPAPRDRPDRGTGRRRSPAECAALRRGRPRHLAAGDAAAAGPRNHTLEVRATDHGGDTRTERRTGTVSDGATGLHAVVVAVT
jgi:hypothetical protein